MGRIVTDQLQGVVILDGDNRELGVRFDRPVEIAHLPIDLHRQRSLGQAGADIGCDLRAGHATRMSARAAIGQRDRDLVGGS